MRSRSIPEKHESWPHDVMLRCTAKKLIIFSQLLKFPCGRTWNKFSCFILQVTYRSETSVYPFSRLALSHDPNMRVIGDVSWRCNEIDYSGPIAFKTSNSFLKFSPWRDPRQIRIKFDFRTTEQV